MPKYDQETQAAILDAGTHYLAEMESSLTHEDDYEHLLAQVNDMETEMFGIDHDQFQIGNDGKYHPVDDEPEE